MRRARYEYKITGIKTSIKYLERIMNHTNFIDGKYDTHFIENHQKELMNKSGHKDISDMVVVAAFIDYLQKITSTQENTKDFVTPQSRWKNIPYINHF